MQVIATRINRKNTGGAHGYKILSEIVTGKALFATMDNVPVFSAPPAHLTGAVVAILFFIKTKS